MIANQFTARLVLRHIHLVEIQHFGNPDLIGITSARVWPAAGDVIGKRFFSLVAFINAEARASLKSPVSDEPERFSPLALVEPEPCAFAVLRHFSLHASKPVRVIM